MDIAFQKENLRQWIEGNWSKNCSETLSNITNIRALIDLIGEPYSTDLYEICLDIEEVSGVALGHERNVFTDEEYADIQKLISDLKNKHALIDKD